MRLWVVLFMMSAAAMAQTQTPAAADGREMGGFQVEQSVELGYRYVDVTGNKDIYDTFIDQNQGPRVLEQTLSIRSPQHAGALFDDLFLSSFGWGGDPENVARARVSKYKLYDFSALFRRDHNFFNYNLLANPLNPPTSNPNVPVDFSPHSMDIKRRMYDFGLTLLPASRVSVRLGYSRNRSEGPSFTSFHEGTDVLLAQPWNVTQDMYRVGVDLKVLPKTTISYDQFYSLDRTDTDTFLAPFAQYPLTTGANPLMVEFGLPINVAAGQPCNNAVSSTGLANPACNGYFAYSRYLRARTTNPTEQLTFTSNYFKRVNLTGHVSYSSADMNTPYSEFFDGLVTRTRERQFTFGGPASVRRLSTNADIAGSFEVTDGIRITDSFRYDNWRIPGLWDSVETATLAAGTPATLLSGLGTTTSTSETFYNFLGMRTFQNLFQVEYSPVKQFGVNVGYRWRQRRVLEFVPTDEQPQEFDIDRTINEHGPLLTVWMRPMDALRINMEVEATTADNFLTRISPRQRQQVRGRVSYKPGRWGTMSASVNFNESRNGAFDTQYAQHFRNAGFLTTLFPTERFSMDLSYNYSDILQDAYICYNGTFQAPGTIAGACPTFSSSENNNPNWIYSIYENNTHYFSGTVMFKPVPKVTTNIGYGITKTDGNATILNTLQPLGPLQFTYHQPLASVSVEVMKSVNLNAYWNYDQYREAGVAGPTLPRNFHDNRGVLSVRYAF
ncbi:MAG TPA: hypothetical protein VN577_17105 [Terriglobales bacterium]|nr:hypothetical protein [Terriglobales bacterium]